LARSRGRRPDRHDADAPLDLPAADRASGPDHDSAGILEPPLQFLCDEEIVLDHEERKPSGNRRFQLWMMCLSSITTTPRFMPRSTDSRYAL
jgi:hypothetical protein